MNITNKVTEITGASYGQSREKDVSLTTSATTFASSMESWS